MKWLGCDWDGTGLMGVPGHYVRVTIPELIEEEAKAMQSR